MVAITKEFLERRLQELEKAKAEIAAKLNAQIGAIIDCQDMLAELEREESKSEEEKA